MLAKSGYRHVIFFKVPHIYVNYLNVARETTILAQITSINAFLSLYEHKTGPGGYI